ncbi:hypothetical protein H6G41_11660 [Tolypothrix sp. FACHB-123]|uniref:hypothetical protein n=1 Tax=Tolypothrix sp. FACHB-123 TaxID=2692868 RepID=UPI00168226AC|nr:hypothetical protein [Tolypothrix sp. FACHB-123]MBD2355267.1 hypothetical protein [Tolypothrix sp. FACHB-123]
MYKINHFFWQKIGLAGTAFGSLLIGFSSITPSAVAQQTSKINPCPSIFYEVPHRDRVMVPAGCPPNAATLRMQQQRQTLGQPTVIVVPIRPGVRPIQPPIPENRQSAIATVTPTAGTVNVKLKNNTNAGISYQAIGYTQPRYLAGGQEFILQDLPTPVSITLVRPDGGLIKVMPMSTSQGTLSVSLDETTNFNNDQGVLRIQRDGQVFLN